MREKWSQKRKVQKQTRTSKNLVYDEGGFSHWQGKGGWVNKGCWDKWLTSCGKNRFIPHSTYHRTTRKKYKESLYNLRGGEGLSQHYTKVRNHVGNDIFNYRNEKLLDFKKSP